MPTLRRDRPLDAVMTPLERATSRFFANAL
jgi:hypothetical protein